MARVREKQKKPVLDSNTIGFKGGEKVIVRDLEMFPEGDDNQQVCNSYKVQERLKIEDSTGTDHFPLRRLRFDSNKNLIIGFGWCGGTSYVARNKADAQAIIAFLKDCYQIED